MDRIREQMMQLFSTEWNGKTVWKYIRDNELTSAPSFKGNLYDTTPIKIMYVGHAVNGWEEFDVSTCTSIEETLDVVLGQDGPTALDTFVNAAGSHYTKGTGSQGLYYHINSKFIRLIKQILEFQNESDSPTTHTSWYNDTKSWNQKFVWSNLYNIAPRKHGNPENQFIKLGMSHYTEMMRIQLETYKPDIVIFCPLSGYFTPWKREPSFDELLDSYEECENSGPIIGKGKLGKTQIIVCKRPDARGTSYEAVREMAKVISDYIDRVCKEPGAPPR